MRIAFTLNRGRNDGEYLREINPIFIQQRKALEKKLEAARKRK